MESQSIKPNIQERKKEEGLDYSIPDQLFRRFEENYGYDMEELSDEQLLTYENDVDKVLSDLEMQKARNVIEGKVPATGNAWDNPVFPYIMTAQGHQIKVLAEMARRWKAMKNSR